MNKINITEEVFRKESENPIKFEEISNQGFEPNDIIQCGYNEGYFSENNSWDSHYFIIVTRERLETDKEFEKRKNKFDKLKEDGENNLIKRSINSLPKYKKLILLEQLKNNLENDPT